MNPHRTDLLAAVMNDPDAPNIIEAAAAALAEEQRRRMEFREWMSDDIKAEFINGEIILHSPVKRRHLIASGLLYRLLSTYVDKHDLGAHGHEKAMITLTRNDYEPDICFWSKEKSAQFNGDTMLHPAPDFVVEILSTRITKTDRGVKFQDYAHHGIREYWIIDPNKELIEQYGLLTEKDREYLPYGKFAPGEDIQSIAIPGFVIPVAAVFNQKTNMETLGKMLK
jgi:Uma2 family endonuclease